MLAEQFVNNASSTLQTAVTTGDTEFFLSDLIADTAWDDVTFDSYYFLRATLSHPDTTDMEIVFVTSLYTGVGNKIHVIRGRELTLARAWPAGTKVESRATAGMLHDLSRNTIFDGDKRGLSIANGENVKVYNPFGGNRVLVGYSWAIGGIPAIVEKGVDDYFPMSAAVEGVGSSASVELGVAPDYDSQADYYAGAIVRDPNPPHTVYSMSTGVDLAGPKPALGEGYWVEVPVDGDGVVFRVAKEEGWDDPDVRFYPTEIGFICDAHTAATPPTVSVGELDAMGEVVSMNNLASGVALTALDGAHQRAVLTNSVKNGVFGLIFSLDTAASGGSFKGRFYWKGLFVCSNSAAGWPTAFPTPDGRP